MLPTGNAAGGDKVAGTNGNASIQGIATADALTYHPHPKPRTDPGASGGVGTPRFGTLSLEYAVKCLRNCLFLLSQPNLDAAGAAGGAAAAATPEPEPEPASSGGGAGAGSTTSTNGVGSSSASSAASASASGATPSEEELRRQKEALTVKQAALVYQAYVALSLDDPLSSLSAATDLLHMPPEKVTPGNRYLAHTYAAEALCMLDRPGQAEKHLAPTLVSRDSYPAGSTTQEAASALSAAAASGEGGVGEGRGSIAQGYGSFLVNQPGREEGGAAASSTLPAGGPSAPQFSVFSGDCVSKHSKCTLYCNLAVAMVAQDKIPQAQQLVGQALLAPPNAAP